MQKIKCKKCNAEIKNLGDNIEKVEIYDQYETGYIANDVLRK